MTSLKDIGENLANLNKPSANIEKEAKTIAWKGQQFAERLVRLYSADMVKAFYAHYHGLFEAETAVGDPTLASYYLSVSNTLYANIPKTSREEADEVDSIA